MIQNDMENPCKTLWLEERVKELEGVLQEVDAWVEDLGVYADPSYQPAPIFFKVREALSGKCNTGD